MTVEVWDNGWKWNVPEDAEQLVNLGVTVEQRLLGEHLGKDASNGPDVHGPGVASAAQEDLRGAVPQGDNLQHKTTKTTDYRCKSTPKKLEE